MSNIKLGTQIQHKDYSVVHGKLTRLKGQVNQDRGLWLVELNNIWTNYKLKDFKLSSV